MDSQAKTDRRRRFSFQQQLLLAVSLLGLLSVTTLRSGSRRAESTVDKPALEMIWLLSFPNSGTTYTLELVSALTRTFTASVYGIESVKAVGPSHVPVYADEETTSPFWVYHDNATDILHPTRYVLTKTHCGTKMDHDNVETFLKGCATNNYRVGRNRRKTQHDTEQVKKAIHLIRNPFDNIVSRFRFERRHPAHEVFPTTTEGFRGYCEYTKDQVLAKEWTLHRNILPYLEGVPCPFDFLRYLRWHNLAFETTEKLGIETMILHYESYENDFDGTSQKLINFLELEQRGEPAPFLTGKTYVDYFSEAEKKAVTLAYRAMASPATRVHLDRYFDQTLLSS